MRYRAAIRYFDGRPRYHIEDIDAESMAAALRRLVEAAPAAVLDAADLVEVRPRIEDEERVYSAG